MGIRINTRSQGQPGQSFRQQDSSHSSADQQNAETHESKLTQSTLVKIDDHSSRVQKAYKQLSDRVNTADNTSRVDAACETLDQACGILTRLRDIANSQGNQASFSAIDPLAIADEFNSLTKDLAQLKAQLLLSEQDANARDKTNLLDPARAQFEHAWKGVESLKNLSAAGTTHRPNPSTQFPLSTDARVRELDSAIGKIAAHREYLMNLNKHQPNEQVEKTNSSKEPADATVLRADAKLDSIISAGLESVRTAMAKLDAGQALRLLGLE
jgi:hypothetical protein